MPRIAPPVRALALVTLCGSVLAGCVPASLGTEAAETVAAPLGLPLVDGVTVQEGLVYAAPDGAELALDACLPATGSSEARPAIILVQKGLPMLFASAACEHVFSESFVAVLALLVEGFVACLRSLRAATTA